MMQPRVRRPFADTAPKPRPGMRPRCARALRGPPGLGAVTDASYSV